MRGVNANHYQIDRHRAQKVRRRVSRHYSRGVRPEVASFRSSAFGHDGIICSRLPLAPLRPLDSASDEKGPTNFSGRHSVCRLPTIAAMLSHHGKSLSVTFLTSRAATGERFAATVGTDSGLPPSSGQFLICQIPRWLSVRPHS